MDNYKFHIDQQVVALRNTSSWKKGQIFTVRNIRQGCHTLDVDIGLGIPTSCYICNRNTGGSWFDSNEFAPVTHDFIPVSLTKILEEETHLIGAN